MNSKNKYWLIINNYRFKDCKRCLKAYDNKKFKYSPWIKDIVEKNNYKFDKKKLPVKLLKITLKQMGFTKPQKLIAVIKKIKKLGFKLVSPEVAIYCRLLYKKQSAGEWLIFATPLKSMIDSDGIPHLPKIGKALNTFFIETYWSYPGAVFHPHNELVVMK